MTKNDRSKDTIGCLFRLEDNSSSNCFILSSSDIGVRRNFGRPGSRLGPRAIINTFKKLSNSDLKHLNFTHYEVSSQADELKSFEEAQENERSKIASILKKHESVIQIGGGHDHVYPMIKALSQKIDKDIYIINIDAHLDTRVDKNNHSGTPFRNLDSLNNANIHLYQYGIHNYSNSTSTMQELKNIKQYVFGKGNQDFYKKLKSIPENSFVFLSLDADALDSSQMQAVSAVNPDGISMDEMRDIIRIVKVFKFRAFGIYEFNPVYDDLSQKGAKNICSLIYNYII